MGSARCPYPTCAAAVFAFAEHGAVTELLDARRVARAYTTRAFTDLASSLSAAFVALVFVAGPVAAIRAALIHPTRGVGSLLVVLGGTLLVVPAAAFLVLGAVALVQQWQTTRRACARVLRAAACGSAPGSPAQQSGVRLAPTPVSYRAH